MKSRPAVCGNGRSAATRPHDEPRGVPPPPGQVPESGPYIVSRRSTSPPCPATMHEIEARTTETGVMGVRTGFIDGLDRPAAPYRPMSPMPNPAANAARIEGSPTDARR